MNSITHVPHTYRAEALRIDRSGISVIATRYIRATTDPQHVAEVAMSGTKADAVRVRAVTPKEMGMVPLKVAA